MKLILSPKTTVNVETDDVRPSTANVYCPTFTPTSQTTTDSWDIGNLNVDSLNLLDDIDANHLPSLNVDELYLSPGKSIS